MLEAASNAVETPVEDSQNLGYGFCGTMALQAGRVFVDIAWAEAMIQITRATGCGSAQVRAFLDSRHGRFFADGVSSRMIQGAKVQKAIEQEVAQWMAWGVSKSAQADYGIPPGLPYLTGFVVAEAAAAGEL
jgi:hypothetical protein